MIKWKMLTMISIFSILYYTQSWAATIVSSGTNCGQNCSWTLDSEGVLNITGTGTNGVGNMGSWSTMSQVPWDSLRDQVTNINISDGITNIGNYAFLDMKSVTSVTIPDSVSSAGFYAFYRASNLTSVNFGSNPQLTSMSSYAFADTSLSSFVIPSSLQNIPAFAFQNTDLTSITIPDTITSIGSGAFKYATDLTSINFGPNPGITSIEGNTFEHSGLTSIAIPDSVTSIGRYAFWGAADLTSVNFGPDSQLTSIDVYAFKDATSLNRIEVPSSITEIKQGAFSGAAGLEYIDLSAAGGNLTIGKYSFESSSSKLICNTNQMSTTCSAGSLSNAVFSGTLYEFDGEVYKSLTLDSNGVWQYTGEQYINLENLNKGIISVKQDSEGNIIARYDENGTKVYAKGEDGLDYYFDEDGNLKGVAKQGIFTFNEAAAVIKPTGNVVSITW